MTNAHRQSLRTLICLTLIAAGAGVASASVATFEDLGATTGVLPTGYYGFAWTGDPAYINSAHADASWGTNNGFSLTMNGTHAIYTATGMTLTRTSGRFRLNSAVLGAAWNDGQYLRIQAKRAGAVVNVWYGRVAYGGKVGKAPTVFNWDNIDTLVITPNAATGTLHPGVSGSGHMVCLDDLDFSAPMWVGSITPASVRSDAPPVSITNLAGTGFLTGATVTLTRSGFADIVATDVVVVSDSKITCTLPTTGSAVGSRNVVVTNPDATTATLTNGFSVTPGPPTVTSFSPPYAVNTGVLACHIYGTGFTGAASLYHASNPSVTLRMTGQPDVVYTGINMYFFDSTHIGTNTLPVTGLAPGAWDVIVRNSDGQSGTLVGGLTLITAFPTPTVTGITPGSAPNTGPANVTITGTGFFVPSAPGGPTNTVTIQASRGTAITATNVVVTSPTELTCTLPITGAGWGPLYPYNVRVQAPNAGATGSLASAFVVTVPMLTLTAVTPSSGRNNAATNSCVVSGTGFVGTPGYQAYLSCKLKQGATTLTAPNVNYLNATTLNQLSFPTSGAPVGMYDLEVTNGDGSVATLPNAFSVYSGAKATVTAITPTSAMNDAPVVITNLAGTLFAAGAAVALQKAGQPDIPGTSVILTGATKITCVFDITGAAPGTWDVAVTNPGSIPGVKTAAFTVISAPPSIDSITPDAGPNTGPVVITDLAGTSFGPTSQLVLRRVGETDIAATDPVVASTTKITCSFDITGATTGPWDVVLSDADGHTATLGDGFTVQDPAPTVTAITPSTGLNTGSVSITDLAGTDFRAGATVELTKTGETPIAATNVAVQSGTQITCDLDLTGAAVGPWSVVVTNDDAQSGTLTDGFTVTYPAPTVASITPSTGLNTGLVSVTGLAGTYFRDGATVELTKAGETAIAATSVVVVSGTQITCDLDLTGAAVGPWSVVVTNDDAQSGALADGFTVTYPAPTVTAITPSTGPNNGAVSITDLVGTGFLTGATVELTRGGETPIAASNAQVVSATQVSCDLDLTGAAVGAWSVLVTNPDSQSGSLTDGFTVTYPAPTVTGITPSTGLNTGSVSITDLAGTDFRAGATVELTKTGETPIAATNVAVQSGTQITCGFALTGAAVGAWNVVVTNPDAQSGTLTNGFGVEYPAPTVSSITPSSAPANDPFVPISSLVGTGFRSGATVQLDDGFGPITATGVVVVDPALITCNFNMVGSVPGPYDVVVTNTDGKSGRLLAGFQVTAADVSPPQILSVRSAATHGNGIGERAPVCPQGYVEARSSGIAKLIVTFSKALDPSSVSTSAVSILNSVGTDLSASVSAVALTTGDTVLTITINPALPDRGTYTITLAATICDLVANPLGGVRAYVMSALAGDVTGDKLVNATDANTISPLRNQVVTEARARYDLNLDGRITSADMLYAQGRSGNTAP